MPYAPGAVADSPERKGLLCVAALAAACPARPPLGLVRRGPLDDFPRWLGIPLIDDVDDPLVAKQN
jgi:hypothetical protein